MSVPRSPLVRVRRRCTTLVSPLARAARTILIRPSARHCAALLLMLGVLAATLATPAAAQQKTKQPPPPTNPTPQICPQSAPGDMSPQIVCNGTVIPMVTPDGAAVTASVGANSYVFTVRNTGTALGPIYLTPTCSGAASGCTVSPTTVSLAAGAQRTVTMSYTGSSAGGTGVVDLAAQDAGGTAWDDGWINVTIPPPAPTYNVSMTPDAGSYSMAAGTSTYNFTVTNTGTGDATYTLTPSCGGMVTGCSAPGSVYVPHGSSAQVGVSITASTPGTSGTVNLSASYGGYSDGGSLNVSVNDSYQVAVTPDNQSQVVSPSGSVTFYVQNLGSIQTFFQFSVNCSCSLSTYSATVNPGYASGVQVTVSLNGYSGTVVLTASDQAHGTSDTGSIIVSGPTYTVAVSPDGYPDQWYESGQAGTANFTVSNSGNSAATYSLSATCDPAATCSTPPPSVSVSPGSSASVPISFTAGVGGSSGYVRLNASGPSSDAGSVHVLVYSHTVAVAPPAAVSVDPGSYTASFGVTNTGNTSTTYNLTSTCSGQITGCAGSLGQITVAAGATTPVNVGYTAVNRGDAGGVALAASWVGNAAVAGSGTMSVTVKHSYAVAVTPDNQSQIVSPTGAVSFYVQNLGSVQNSFNLSVNCGTCGLSASTVTVNPGVSSGVTVSLNGTTGNVTLTASDAAHGVSDQGSIIVTAPTYSVSVSPDTNPQTVAQPIDGGKPGSQTFSVYNGGNSTANYTIAVNCPSTYIANCTWPTTLSVPSLTTGSVTVGFSATQTAGVATITLTASSQNTSDVGTGRWQVNTHFAWVTPKAGSATVYAGPGITQLFSVQNTGSVPNSYTLTTTPCSGTVSACTASPASITNLGVGLTQSVTVTYTGANAGGAGVAKLVATNTVDTARIDTGSVNVTVKPKYTVAVTPDAGPVQADAWTTASVPFTVTYSGTAASGRYALSVTACDGTAKRGPCTIDSATVTVTPGAPKQVKVSFAAGAPRDTAAISVRATSLDEATFTDPGSARLTVTAYAVSVTPDTLPVTPAAYATNTQPFTVTNTGTTTRVFNLQTACARPAVTACSVIPGVLSLGPTASGAATVTYTAGDPGATGTLRLVATDTLGRSTDGGTLLVAVGASVAVNKVQVNEVNPGTTIERSQCLVFPIVSDVADECGALRIVHPLPAVRTLGKARVPTLLYSSDHVQGPTLAVNVILADTTTIPLRVHLTVIRTGVGARTDTVSFPGGDWQVNRRRRIAMPLVAAGPTRILPFTVEVRLKYAASNPLAAPAVSGELAVVDRTTSSFGGGWWLAGLEQLYPAQYDSSVMWVAGDGSTRKYVNQHTTVGPDRDTVWLASAFTSPDTLLHRADGKYRRQAGNGLYVEFNPLGQHLRTVNRLDYATVFTYDGSSRLSTIQLPPLQSGGTPAHTYRFAYNTTSGPLDSVIAPSVNNMTRRVALARYLTTSKVKSITEMLGDSTYQVKFDTQPGLVYVWRSDRRNVPTTIAYEASSPTIASFATGTGVGSDTVRHAFRTTGSLGTISGGSIPIDSVYFRYDGPRPAPVIDVTKFWLDRFSAPARIVNALGNETTIARGDPRFPGLATETRGPAPNFFTTWAAYDARGNLRTSTQVNPHDDGKDATTTYAWHPTWDMVTQVVLPEGEVTNIGYDATTGDRLSQEDGRGLASRVSFQYYTPTDPTPGAKARLLSIITLPATSTPTAPLTAVTTKVTYDSLGNVNTTWTPRGAWTTETNDAIGRTTTTTSQITAAGEVATTTLTYDLSDRVTRSVSSGTPMNGVGAQSAIVESVYDREARLQRVSRKQSPDNSRSFLTLQTFPPLDSLISRYTYDNLGRKLAEFAPDSTPATDADSTADYTFYDLAGNVERVKTRRKDNVSSPPSPPDTNYVIMMTYDALNRLKTRTVPDAKYRARVDGYSLADQGTQDTVNLGYNLPYPRFPNNSYVATNPHTAYPNRGGYTVSGNMATFDYDEAGNMTIADNADARVRRKYYRNGQLRYDTLYTKTLARDTVHKYVIEYLYDRDGRQTTLKHPGTLSPGYQTQSQYDPITGALAKVIDPLNHVFTFGIDERNQPTTLGMPRSFGERYGYDQDGDPTMLWSGANGAALHDVSMTYDLRGKMLTLLNAVAAHDTITMGYSGLGHLVSNTHVTWLKSDSLTRYTTTEHFTFDPLGNRQHSDVTRWTDIKYGNCGWATSCFHNQSIGGDQSEWYYQAGTGRLVFDGHDGNASQEVTQYDGSGNIVFSGQKPNVTPNTYVDRASYYGADGALAAVDFRLINPTTWTIAFDEYRYDALGRRIVVRSRRLCGMPYKVTCTQSYVRRTVWAGAQELYEIQMPDAPTVREYDTETLAANARDGDTYDPNPMYGRVAYTFGQKLDQPLSIVRLGYMNYLGEIWSPFSMVPLWTQRGTADTSFFAATGSTNCNAAGRCVLVGYPDQYWTPAFSRYYTPAMFQGTLLSDKSDHSGQLFRRNRYYDPAMGRFTQEDPIGLAGGMNLYGFGGGDPVNFSDPFGLCGVSNDDTGGDTTKTAKPSVTCEYTQSTGALTCTDQKGKPFSETGYSGWGILKNWPGAESAKYIKGVQPGGPIPVGTYTIAPAMPDKNYKGKGPVVMRLIPDESNVMFDRNGFLFHGDNASHDASEGCIIMSRPTRDKLAGGGTLTVKH